MRRITQSDLGVNGSHVPAGLPPAARANDARQPEHSDALRAANARLLAQRQQRAASVARETPRADVAPGQHAAVRACSALPAHLGWHSARVTDHLRKALAARALDAPLPDAPPAVVIPLPSSAQPDPVPTAATSDRLRAWPALLLALLRHAHAAAGRVWLLARHIDRAGRGWLPLETLRSALTTKASALRVCGQRRLRQLLAEGEGLFWQRARDRAGRVRIWLTGIARVAQALGVAAIDRPIWLPVSALTGPIADVRAHFYAAFHSRRAPSGAPAAAWGNPIGRRALRQLSGRSARTQRRYDRRLGVARRSTIAVAAPYSADALREQLWQGHVAFEFVDSRGHQGPPGARYVAWRLPNQYRGCHPHAPRGRQRTINRQLRGQPARQPATTDLVMQRGRGNGQTGQTNGIRVKLFHRAARVAQHRRHDHYWPAGDAGVWHVIPATAADRVRAARPTISSGGGKQ